MKVYRYGLLRPTENASLVLSQMRLAHRYRNTLVEIERARRDAQRALITSYGDIAALEARHKELDAHVCDLLRAVKLEKAATRSLASPEARALVTRAKEARRANLGELRAARLAAKPDLERRGAEIEERAKWLRNNARAHNGVYWGTYLLTEDADMAARRMPLYDGALANSPSFVRFCGEGQVGVQLQGGLGLDELPSDTQLRLEPAAAAAGADPTSRRSALRKRMILAMRVGSDEKKRPIWARWPMVMHRPLPPGSVIKRAAVVLRRVGPREEWSVIITLDLSGTTARATDPGLPRVGMDLGWRLLPDGAIRLAAWFDGTTEGTFNVPSGLIDRLRKAESLRAIRDTNFNAARQALAAALGRMTSDGPVSPPWLLKEVEHLGAWRSPGRLAALAQRWGCERFDGDSNAYEALEAWRYHDHHLWEWECAQRLKALRHRREVYRVFAAELSRKYSTLVLEDWNMSETARREAPESAAPQIDAARSNRVLVAPSELRDALVGAFAGRWEKVPAPGTTYVCHSCGSAETWDQAAEVVHTCSACLTTWDQDFNAARNILAAASGRGDAQTPVPARTDGEGREIKEIAESRWARAKRMRTEKETKRGTARDQDSEAAE